MILHLSLLEDHSDLLDTIRTEMKVSRGLESLSSSQGHEYIFLPFTKMLSKDTLKFRKV